MRIGLVVPGFSADTADWCIPALRHLVRALARKDDVRVFATRYPYRSGRYPIDGADVTAIGGAEARGVAIASVWRATLDALRAAHAERPFDVLHAFWATESGLLASLAGQMLRVPTLVSLAGGELVRLPSIGYGDQLSAWERVKIAGALRLATRVTGGSFELLRLARRFVPPRKLERAPLGVPLDRFSPGAAPGTGLLHVATLTAIKDQVTLLRAFALVRRQAPGTCLRIVGNGPLHGSLEALAVQLGLGEDVRFEGDVDHGLLPDVYRGSRVFVLSSLHEAQGMVALEAAACGLAIVGTRVGIIPEIAAPPYVAECGDARGLADATLAALAHLSAPDVSAFGLEACTDRFRSLYVRLAR
jgi:glycosyltransferase involved in cell wall biosynthesis